MTPQQPENHEPFTALDQLREPFIWSGASLVPEIGATVHVSMNGLGPGTVEAYILDEGRVGAARYLGVRVHLKAPPRHFLQQLRKKGGSRPVVTVFGIELRADADATPPLCLPIITHDQVRTLIVHHDGRTELEGAATLYQQERSVTPLMLQGLAHFQSFLRALDEGHKVEVYETQDRPRPTYAFRVDGRCFSWPRSTLRAYTAMQQTPTLTGMTAVYGTIRLSGPAGDALMHLRELVMPIELELLGEAMLWPHAPVLQALSPLTRARVATVLTGLRSAQEVLAELLPVTGPLTSWEMDR